jgi:hypothetical protein
MAKAEDESIPGGHTDKRILEAVHRLPIRPDRLEDVEMAASGLSTTIALAPLLNPIPAKLAAKIAPAAISKQLEKIQRLAQNLSTALNHLPDAVFLIENELRNIPPKDPRRERWGEEQGGPLYTCRRSLLDLVDAAQSASENDFATLYPGANNAKTMINGYVVYLNAWFDAEQMSAPSTVPPSFFGVPALNAWADQQQNVAPIFSIPHCGRARRRGRSRNEAANRLTTEAAFVYERLTGRKASRSSQRFQAFVRALFDIGGINANADRRSRAMAEGRRPRAVDKGRARSVEPDL